MGVFWIIVLFACPPQGGTCELIARYPGRWQDEKPCRYAANDRQNSREGERWMTRPGWEPLFTCTRSDPSAGSGGE